MFTVTAFSIFFSFSFAFCFWLYLKRYSLKLWDQRETDTIFFFSFFFNPTMSKKKNDSLKQHAVKENSREGVVKEPEREQHHLIQMSSTGFLSSSTRRPTFKTLKNVLASPDSCGSLPPCLSAIKCLLHCWIVIYNITWKNKEVEINISGGDHEY